VDQRRLTDIFPAFLSSIVNSYTQIFFSNSRIFALILIAVSFFDLWAGMSGLVAVMVSNGMAYLIGFNRQHIRNGLYGFNSLLVGLGLGVFYQAGPEFFIVLFFSALLTLLITVGMEGVIGKYGLPYLSMPFLLGVWLVSLAARQFTSLQVSERGIYMMNEMYELGGPGMLDAYNWFGTMGLPESLRLYFKSLGAIFFQYHLFAGVLIAVGLLIHSRIAFLLSLTGFFAAYLYYMVIGANIHELSYDYIGFNYILTAIAIGGFFIIPSWWSFLWVILLTPLISILLTSSTALFSIFQLSVYSLPFNIIVLVFLYALKFRERFYNKPELVIYQQYSPEKNLYSNLNYKTRFGKSLYLPLSLPFWGEWKVTQAHNGTFTHKGDWKHAWDFEIIDDEGLSYSGDGLNREDFYAYGKPVVAPADGRIEEVAADVEENAIGEIDLENNWGNTVVIRHEDHLFTKLSHLKKGSILVARDEAVKKGQVIAACGNSGRSPIPHLHFQVQSTPYIGSKTLDYPIGHFIRHKNGKYELKSFEKPGNGVQVSNISRNSSLEKAFHFVPGQVIRYKVKGEKGTETNVTWEVMVDALNNTYIACSGSGSKAWFRNDGDIHYFTHFEGDRNSLLFRFFLGAYKVLLGYYRNLQVFDTYPVNTFNNPFLVVLQDFIAPFWQFMKSGYHFRYLGMEDDVMQTGIRIEAATTLRIGRRLVRKQETGMVISGQGLIRMTFREKNKTIEATLVN
jgi:urea transporter